MIGEEIVLEIDKTLDQLIRNAEVISKVEVEELSESEVDAFQKTQESLLQHLMRMDQVLSTKIKQTRKTPGCKLQEKLLKFERLKSNYTKSIEEKSQNKPIVCKRKAKRFFDLRFRKPLALVR